MKTFVEWYDNGTGWWDAWRAIEAPNLEEAQRLVEPGDIVLPIREDPNQQNATTGECASGSATNQTR